MHTDKNRKPKFHTPTIMQMNFLAVTSTSHHPFFPLLSKWENKVGFPSIYTFQGITVPTATSIQYNKLVTFLLFLGFAHFLTSSLSYLSHCNTIKQIATLIPSNNTTFFFPPNKRHAIPENPPGYYILIQTFVVVWILLS